MKNKLSACLFIASLPFTLCATAASPALSDAEIEAIVSSNIKPLMEKENIPGMAVGIIYQGNSLTFSYGKADTKTQRPVTENTLFELGSVSKTFTGLAAGSAINQGIVNLNDPVKKYWPALPERPWNQIKMLHLATYTAGGLPLQLPDNVTDLDSLQAYYQSWQPASPPGSVRSYSNASIGLFGSLATEKSGLTFEQYLTKNILKPLHLEHTFIHVPPAAEKEYAWGYKQGEPVRVTPGMLDAEAYGIKSSAADMVRYLKANMYPTAATNTPELKRAIETAQTRYFQIDDMYQGLGWEMYNWPADPQKIIAGSSNAVALKPHRAQLLLPAQPATSASWIHKTGSTNGFGTYIAFIPDMNVGIVMLANKNYPNPLRVETAYQIISAMLPQK